MGDAHPESVFLTGNILETGFVITKDASKIAHPLRDFDDIHGRGRLQCEGVLISGVVTCSLVGERRNFVGNLPSGFNGFTFSTDERITSN